MDTAKRTFAAIASAAVLVAIPATAAAQDYPPPEEPAQVLPTTIERAPEDEPEDEPEGAPEQPDEEAAPEPQAGDLARTGADIWPYLALGAAAIAVGSGVVMYSRRRATG